MMKTFTRRRLPHLVPIGGVFFVTTRLAGTIPKSLIFKWQEEKEKMVKTIEKMYASKTDFSPEEKALNNKQKKEQLANNRKRYFKKFDDYLDQSNFGPTWLKAPEVANEVVKKLKDFDGVYYHLLAFSILSNHFHAVFDTGIQVERLPPNITPNEENYVQLG